MRGGGTLYIFVSLLLILFLEVIKVNAKKCDRCGTLYEGDNAYLKVGELRLIRNQEWRDECLDLCPHCKLSLNGWFKHYVDFIYDKEDNTK